MRSPVDLDALARDLAPLARRKPDELAARVETLTVAEQAELALRLPAAERLELLLHAPKLRKVAREKVEAPVEEREDSTMYEGETEVVDEGSDGLRSVTYRVFYKNDLATGNWTLLTSVIGDGTVKSPEDTIAAGGRRFFQVVAP